MNNLRLILFVSIFFLLKENVVAQPENSFKNKIKIVQDSIGNQDPVVLEDKTFWQKYSPAIALSGGFHGKIRSWESSEETLPAFGIGPAWNGIIDFPLDERHRFNWEFSLFKMYGADSTGQTISTDCLSFAGLRFYFADRSATWRPSLCITVAEAGFYYIPTKLNISGGIDYTLTPSFSIMCTAGHVYSYNDSYDLNGFGVFTSYAGFLGVRYQL